MKLKVLLLALGLSSCVNIGDYYGVAQCNNKACEYKDYATRGSLLLDSVYDYDYQRVITKAVVKSTQMCLISYAIIPDHFPSEDSIFEFHWERRINADYAYYARLETNSSLLIDPPFKIKYLETAGEAKKLSFIFFYVKKERAINCYNIMEENVY